MTALMLPQLSRSYTTHNLNSYRGSKDEHLEDSKTAQGCMLFSKKYSNMYKRSTGGLPGSRQSQQSQRSRQIEWAGEEGEFEKKRKQSTNDSRKSTRQPSSAFSSDLHNNARKSSTVVNTRTTRSPHWREHSLVKQAISSAATPRYVTNTTDPFTSINQMHTEAVLIQKRRPGYRGLQSTSSTSEVQYLTTQMLSEHRRIAETEYARHHLLTRGGGAAASTECTTGRVPSAHWREYSRVQSRCSVEHVSENMFLDQIKFDNILEWLEKVEQARSTNSFVSVFSC